MERWIKPAFSVIGMEGSTVEDPAIVPKLWEAANSRFAEVAGLAKTNPDGSLAGVWGVMTDISRSFMPWEDGFSRGLYLAGVECRADTAAPEGWTRWDVPGFEYVRVIVDASDVFQRTLAALAEKGLTLAGAVHDFTDPATGRMFMCFPVRRLSD